MNGILEYKLLRLASLGICEVWRDLHVSVMSIALCRGTSICSSVPTDDLLGSFQIGIIIIF